MAPPWNRRSGAFLDSVVLTSCSRGYIEHVRAFVLSWDGRNHRIGVHRCSCLAIGHGVLTDVTAQWCKTSHETDAVRSRQTTMICAYRFGTKQVHHGPIARHRVPRQRVHHARVVHRTSPRMPRVIQSAPWSTSSQALPILHKSPSIFCESTHSP